MTSPPYRAVKTIARQLGADTAFLDRLEHVSDFDAFEIIRLTYRLNPQLLAITAKIMAMPVATLDTVWIDSASQDKFDLAACRTHDVAPLYWSELACAIAVVNPFNPYTLAHTCIKRVLIDSSTLMQYWESQSHTTDPLHAILLDALHYSASDIHIYNRHGKGHVYYRILSELTPMQVMPKARFTQFLNQLKFKARLNYSQTQTPQDGRLSIPYQDTSVDARVALIPTSSGDDIAIRLFNAQTGFSIAACGFSDADQATLKHLVTQDSGLILVTGATGSGKTTTLYALLHELKHAAKNIITLEDPIEYYFDFMRQTQINTLAGYTFSTGLRAILRQDPDIIMLGEIRDAETAMIACQAAYTGHLVLASLHSQTVESTLLRLQQLGLDHALVQGCLKGIINQKLTMKPCVLCDSTGCKTCYYTGISGRTVHTTIATTGLRTLVQTHA